jgi:hypothetical protein
MNSLKRFIVSLLAATLLAPYHLFAAQPLKKVRAAFTAFGYANPPFWLAKDLRVFEKYGLDVELVYVGGARNIQALGIRFVLDFVAARRLTIKTKNQQISST